MRPASTATLRRPLRAIAKDPEAGASGRNAAPSRALSLALCSVLCLALGGCVGGSNAVGSDGKSPQRYAASAPDNPSALAAGPTESATASAAASSPAEVASVPTHEGDDAAASSGSTGGQSIAADATAREIASDTGGRNGDVSAPSGDAAKPDAAGKQGRKLLAARVFADEGRDPACGKGKGVGQALPTFDLPSTTGKNQSSRSVRGQVTLVNFWATWCKPCLSELPKFNKIAKRYRKNGLRFLAISTDEDGPAVQELLQEKALSMQALYSGEALAKQFGDRPLPFTLVVDHRGKVVAVYDGFREDCLSSLETDLRDALDAKSAR